MATLVLLLLFYLFHLQLDVLALPASSDYTKELYDYIVIGGGTAGCSLAATLSEKYSVLVLERGNVPAAYPQVLSANGTLSNLIQEDNGKTPAQRFRSEDGVANARGRILGGSSMINIGIYSRAEDEFYRESGIPWDKDLVLKAYKWVEETIVFQYNLSAWQSIAKQALLEAGVVPDNGFNLNHIVGTKATGSTFDDKGRRHGAVELLNRGELKNLQVAVEATVERIIISNKFPSKDSSLTAIGVKYSDSKGRTHHAFVRNKGEVILSAGTIGSPQLLLLSGVGPVPDLSSLQIPVVHHNPYVGKFMADNPRNNINIVVPFALDPSLAQVVGITSEFNYIETLSYTLPFSFPIPFGLFPNAISPLNASLATIAVKIQGPLSSGSLRLASSSEVRVSPIVRFNYFDNPIDLARCVKGVRKVGDVLKTKALEPFKTRDLQGRESFMFLGPSLPKNQSDESAMDKFCRASVTTFWHYHGGCLVGKVVNGDLRVMGINGLRVVDGSIFNRSPGTNPQATIMMLGRYVGLKMLQERS
ncbi:(R)-mandelonitrile lyase 2 isoform X2 [Ziziphus jujuba]|uniref:(R)-mandelonitrile lyase n=1 Tax=Ziziphus jujuba TaxID=326968 RepID=A0ABM3IBG6_ZIZJJ|nr:(R)-mandelonitrile lyase 2 isoform X2 [Ziziphus jujuba]